MIITEDILTTIVDNKNKLNNKQLRILRILHKKLIWKETILGKNISEAIYNKLKFYKAGANRERKKLKIAETNPSYNPSKSNDYYNSVEFLQSYEWRRLRMEVIKKYGARCQCCGATPNDGITINVDHIKSRRLHPELALDINNLQVLCNPCNHGKGFKDETDWRPK